MSGLPKEENKTFRVLSAIGIICVVMGHMGCTMFTIDGYFNYYSFYMPLFAFISGYFYKTDYEQKILIYIKKKVKRLIIPFYKVSLFYTIMHTFLKRYGFKDGLTFSFKNWLLYPWCHDQCPGFNVATWFLIALFLVCVFYIIVRVSIGRILGIYKKTENILIGILFLFLFIFVTTSPQVSGIKVVIFRSIFLLLFYHCGYCYKEYFETRDSLPTWLYFLVIFSARSVLSWKYGTCYYGTYNCTFDIPWWIVLSAAMLGISFWLRTSRVLSPVLNNSKIVSYIGTHTMEIMSHHLFALYLIQGSIGLASTKIGLFSDFDLSGYHNWVYYIYAPLFGMRFAYVVLSIFLVCMYSVLKERIIKLYS